MTVFCAALISCSRSDVVYSSFVDIPAQGWATDEYCDFPTAQLDSTLFVDKAARYDLILAVRHTERYPFSDLWLLTQQDERRVAELPDTIHLTLADPSGSWRGRSAKGIYMYTDTVARGVAVPELYDLRLRPDMSVPVIEGLLGIGLIIEKSK